MKIILLILFLLSFRIVFSQDAESLYNDAMKKAESGDIEGAILLLDKSIELKNDEYVAWYNRGICKFLLGYHEGALLDFEQTLVLYPEYKKGYISRGNAKKRLTDYRGAINDYTHVISTDPKYTDGYYNRGLVYEMLGLRDSACVDFQKALDLGLQKASKKTEKCNDPNYDASKISVILSLEQISNDPEYGFTPNKPVKVGQGPDGGAGNESAYLDLLRDHSGKPLKYTRKGSCCPYKTENGIMGIALLDNYEITYRDEQGNERKTNIYISFYDYETPLVLYGLKSVNLK
jgi:tetratricopeptide (TPR) repeat protein